MKRLIEYTVTEEHDGCTVSDILRSRLRMSGTLVKELKAHDDGITVNGCHARTVDRVRSGDTVRAAIYDSASDTVVPRSMTLDIVYEDEDILVVNKPGGMPTHPSAGHLDDTLANGIAAHYIANGEEHLFRAVNRLDKDTSGLMCVAKNSYAHTLLIDQLHGGGMERRYLAIVTGRLTGEGTVDAPIARESFLKRAVRSDGKRAVTHYRAKGGGNGCTLVELALETGRTHQIRVHMAYIGHPLLGDWLYGTEDRELFPRQALHSQSLSLTHPVTGQKMIFSSELPEDMSSFLHK